MDLGQKLHTFYLRVVDSEASGSAVSVARGLLWPLSLLYSGVVRIRNALYHRGYLSSQRAALPVISVGNITAGGTGKTPFCAWLAAFLQSEGLQPAILSRGYGHDEATGVDDENRMLSSAAPDVPIVINPDRVEGAATARAHAGADVAVLDDGFQHRRLARDVDIVLVDALLPFGGGHLLPRGLLREPPEGLARADVVVITRSDLVSREKLREMCSRIGEFAPDTPVAFAAHRPESLQKLRPGGGREQEPLDTLMDGRWGAFCGIGNPRGFRETLRETGTDVALFRPFPDHHSYEADELQELMDDAGQAGCDALVTTEKDAGKLLPLLQSLRQVPVYVLTVEMQITENEERLKALLRERITSRADGRSR